MGKPGAIEYPPLFSESFHPLSLAEIKVSCVDAFPLSKTRPDIFAGLEMLVEFLLASGVPGKLWIDGSFATAKINPDDADVVLECDGNLFNCDPGPMRQAIDKMLSGLKKDLHCQTYVHFTYPPDHDLYNHSKWEYCWFVGRWGWCDTLEPKGIVTFDLAGDAP